MKRFESEKDYYQPIEIESAFDINFINYEFNDDEDKTSSLNQ